VHKGFHKLLNSVIYIFSTFARAAVRAPVLAGVPRPRLERAAWRAGFDAIPVSCGKTVDSEGIQ
jgi:hypothetical protein